VSSYLDYLEGAFLVRRLPPLQRSLPKRLTKSPKLHWRDTGLLHALLGVRTQEDLLGQPWVGASWEGFVLEQALSVLNARGIDLILEIPGARWAIEVKLSSSPSPEDLQRLARPANWIGATRRVLVSRTRPVESDRGISTNLRGLLTRLKAL
jgi:hypothetical protein